MRARARIKSNDNKHDWEIITKRYDKQMQALITLQLQFEFFQEEIKSNPDLFEVDDKSEFIINIKQVQSYLNNIISEYESCYEDFPDKSFIDDIQILAYDKLPRLNDFIGKIYDAKDFEDKFKKPAKSIIESMKRLLTSS